MANENLKVDENFKPVIGLVTDDASQEIRMGRIDDATKGLKVMLVGGVGGGTVTSISQSTGITLTPNPITSTGTVAIANTAVTPGSYSNASITVDQQGRLTSASSGTASGTVTNVSVVTANGVSGSVATSTTTPAITLTLGAITPTTVNGNTFTTGSSTYTGTAGQTYTFPTTSATIARTDAANTFTGTQTIGALLVTTINALTVTSSTGTLTIAAAKVFTVNNTITLAGTDAQTYTFPTTSATIARTDAGNTFTGVSTGSAWVLTSPTITTKISPTTDDGAPLGDTTHNFSDLFLATGAVLNYANGNVAITHSSGILTMGTGTLKITTPTNTTTSVVTIDGTQTLTNKRATKRVVATTQSATPTINTDNGDIFEIVGLAQAITSMTTNLSGTPVEGDMIEIIFKDNATARAITWGASFASSGNVVLPTTTVLSVPLAVLLQWRTSAVWTATSVWTCIAIA